MQTLEFRTKINTFLCAMLTILSNSPDSNVRKFILTEFRLNLIWWMSYLSDSNIFYYRENSSKSGNNENLHKNTKPKFKLNFLTKKNDRYFIALNSSCWYMICLLWKKYTLWRKTDIIYYIYTDTKNKVFLAVFGYVFFSKSCWKTSKSRIYYNVYYFCCTMNLSIFIKE